MTTTTMKDLFSGPLLIFLLLAGCSNQGDSLLIGAKIYEHGDPYDLLFEQWEKMGINTGFCSEDLISDREFMKQAREHQISTFVIFPVFYNPEAIAATPQFAAVKSNGDAAAEEWVEFVCPSRQEYRNQVLEHARDLVREHQPDGISIDFIRHFVYWEKVYPDRDPESLPLSCFDSVCIGHFEAESGISLPGELNNTEEKAEWILNEHEEAWNRWHCEIITSMASSIAKVAREEKADILVNIHLVPWTREDFNGAILKVAGQDFRALSEIADYLSPMTYAHMVKQNPPWIHRVVEDVYMQTRGKVVPSIQVGQAYLETDYGLEEFRETVNAALQAPSAGLILWSWERLMDEPDKADLFKDMISRH